MTQDNQEKPSGGHSLKELQALSLPQFGLLASKWIDTVEGLIGACASESSRLAMSKLLGLKAPEIAALLDEAKSIVGSSRFEELIAQRPGGSLGFRLERPEEIEETGPDEDEEKP